MATITGEVGRTVPSARSGVLARDGVALEPAASPGPGAIPPTEKPSVAVLPFDNLSGDPDPRHGHHERWLPVVAEGAVMRDRTLVGVGIVGTVVAALCCFTPILVVLLGAVGLSAWLGGVVAVGTALVVFLGLTAYGLYRRQRSPAQAGRP
jgi:mercuric ion transport protein